MKRPRKALGSFRIEIAIGLLDFPPTLRYNRGNDVEDVPVGYESHSLQRTAPWLEARRSLVDEFQHRSRTTK